MSSASVTGTLNAVGNGLVLGIPSPLMLQAAGPGASVTPISYINFTLTGTLVGTWVVQASANNFETFTVLGTYTASQTIIPLALPAGPPSQSWQVRLACTAYTSGTATYTLQLPTLTYAVRNMTGGGTSETIDDNGITLGGMLNLAGNGIETGVVALYGGGQTGATVLSASKTISVIGTALVAADSVMLPPIGTGGVTSGFVKIIYNSTGVSCQIYGSGSDTINAVATGTGVALANKHTGIYICWSLATANLWLAFSAGAA